MRHLGPEWEASGSWGCPSGLGLAEVCGVQCEALRVADEPVASEGEEHLLGFVQVHAGVG